MFRLLPLLLLVVLNSNEVIYTYYFPFMPSIPNVGIGWYAHPITTEKSQALNAYWYYNASSCEYTDRAAVGIVRHHYDWQNCENTNILLVGNEGEFQNQDNLTPNEMVQFIIDVRNHYPNSFLVCLNSVSIDYINDVLELLPDNVCDAIGIHIYHGNNIDIIENINFEGDIWVTEIGWSNNDPDVYDTMYRLTYEVYNHSRVKMIFAYTTTRAHVNSVNMIDEDTGLLLPNGQAFRDAVMAYP